MISKSFIAVGFFILCIVSSAWAITWTTIDHYPTGGTILIDIDGSNIIADYKTIYNLENHTWTPLEPPLHYSALARGISNNNIVGSEENVLGVKCGFLYDGADWKSLDYAAMGISGSNVIGYGDGQGSNAFYGINAIYNLDSQTWTEIDFVGVPQDWFAVKAIDIDGRNVVGFNPEGSEAGFIYNLDSQSWTTLYLPSTISGISGRNIATYGGVYNLDSQIWTPLDFPGASKTWISGIDGDNLVGWYEDASGTTHGFLATIPEPATLLLLGLGAFFLKRRNSYSCCSL